MNNIFPKPVINVAKLPHLTLLLFFSNEFILQETDRDTKAVEMQKIIAKLMLEFREELKHREISNHFVVVPLFPFKLAPNLRTETLQMLQSR